MLNVVHSFLNFNLTTTVYNLMFSAAFLKYLF